MLGNPLNQFSIRKATSKAVHFNNNEYECTELDYDMSRNNIENSNNTKAMYQKDDVGYSNGRCTDNFIETVEIEMSYEN